MRLLLIALAACGGLEHVYPVAYEGHPGPVPQASLSCDSLHSSSVGLTPHSIKRFPGLFGSTNPNRPPEGAAEIAQDTVHRSLDTIESRRGFKASASLGHPLNEIAFKQGKVVAITYNTPSDTGQLNLYDPAADAWSSLPMNPGGLLIDRPGISGAHTRFVSANKALYFQSAYGLTKVEDVATGVCRAALQPPIWVDSLGLRFLGDYATVGLGTNNWLLNLSNTAYRLTLCRFGANKELIESAPSDRLLVSNTSGGSQRVLVNLDNGWMTPPDSFIRIYRSKPQATNASGADATDEMYLVAEVIAKGAASTIDGAGYITKAHLGTYVDETSDGALYVALYTNAQTGNGITQANTPATLSGDMAWFKNRLHLLETSDVQRLTIKVIGTGTGGIQEGDALVVNGVRFRFTAGALGTTGIPLYTGGTVAKNIENTARGVVETVNGYFNTSAIVGAVFASYISLTSTDAGQVVLQSLVPGAAPFTVQTSSASGWDRDYTAGTASDPNAQAAGWMWSSFGEPEAVPTANNDQIGDPTAAGQRIIALKDTLFAFKQDGLWKITDDGSTVGPQVQLLDPTIHLVAPESAVAVDNMIFALADQGAIRITETGAVTNISHIQIERELFKLMGYVGSATLAEKAFGVAYLPEHTYVLCLPESPNATSCTKQYVYNLLSESWTSWNIPGGVISGAVNPDTGQLYFGRADGTLCIERKDFASTDYQDPGFSIASPTTALTKTMVFTGDKTTGTNTIAVGDIIQQFQATNALQQKVVAVAYASGANQTTVTLDAVPRYAWNQAVNLNVVKAIQAQIKFLPFTAGEPLLDKDWGDCYLSFRYCDLDFLTVGFASEKVPITNTAVERVNNADGSNAPITLGAFGAAPFGSAIWGRQAKDISVKCTLPQDFGHSGQLTLSLGLPCALSRFELSAIDLNIAGSTDKLVR